MNYLILHPAPSYVPPVLEEGDVQPTPPTQAELNRRYAQDISERIWAAKHPNPPQGTVTKSYVSHISHDDGRAALVITGEAIATTIDGEIIMSYSDAMRVDPAADTDSLVDAVGDSITADERIVMKGMLEAAKGGGASLLQFAMTVPSLQQRLRTHEQMVADGWFPTNSLL
jgi:hypothetical protein